MICLLEEKVNASKQELKKVREEKLEAMDRLKQIRQKDNNLCCICYENEKDHAYTNCGHMCVCANCLKEEWTEKCPICMEGNQFVIKIYK